MCILQAITNAWAAPLTTQNSVLLSVIQKSSSSLSLPAISSSSSFSLIDVADKRPSTGVPTEVLRNSILDLLSPESPAPHSSLRKRHSKRQSNNFDKFDLDVNSTVLEWVNPCGGFFDPTAVTHHKPNRTAILKKLEEAIEYESLNLKHLRVKDFKSWALYKKTYNKFLPKLKIKSKIGLRRWYSAIQNYTATFAYLVRTQLKSLRSKADNDVADELKFLLRSSRYMLCELEIAINKTHPNHRTRNNLPQVSRDEMNRSLKLITRQKALDEPGINREVHSVDLIYSKVYYKRYVKKMKLLLERFTMENKVSNKMEKNRNRRRKTPAHRRNGNGNQKRTRKTKLSSKA